MDRKQGDGVSAGLGATRVVRIAPMTRAVRVALATSMLAFATSGAAMAGTCSAPDAENVVRCDGDFADTIGYDTDDLTLIVGDDAPTSVTPPPGNPGIRVDATGTLGIVSGADITVDGIGIGATGQAVDVRNDGSVVVTGSEPATGISADGVGTMRIRNDGSVRVDTSNLAFGLRATSATGDVTIDNEGGARVRVESSSEAAGAVFGLSAVSGGGDVDIDNAGDVYVLRAGRSNEAVGAYGRTSSGDVRLRNDGQLGAVSTDGAAVGVDLIADGGDVRVDNRELITANSRDGLPSYHATGVLAAASNLLSIHNYDRVLARSQNGAAIGIAGSASTIELDNSGGISSVGAIESFGMHLVSEDLTTVRNRGWIYATAEFGDATGIYVAANTGGVSVHADTSSSFTIKGATNARGIVARSVHAGDITVDNAGRMRVFSDGDAVGIGAASYGDGSAIDIANSSYLEVRGRDAFGIRAEAMGADTTIDIVNTKRVEVSASRDGSALGAFSSGDARVENLASLSSWSSNDSVGIVASSLNGDASIVNSGILDAVVRLYLTGGGIAYGATAYSQYAQASVENSGKIFAGGTLSIGASARGAGGATASNSGEILAFSNGVPANYAVGLRAESSLGDVAIENSGSIDAGSFYIQGIAGFAAQGDVTIDNAATGTVNVGTNVTGNGIFAVANNGDATIQNAGYIGVEGFGYQLYINGIFGIAEHVEVMNEGRIVVASDGSGSYGIVARASDGDADVVNRGDIEVTAGNNPQFTAHAIDAIGIVAMSRAGDISVGNEGRLATSSTSDGSAFGVYGTAVGDARIANRGSIVVDGRVSSRGVDVSSGGAFTLDNTGTVEVDADGALIGIADAIGVGAKAQSDIALSNAGSIEARAGSADLVAADTLAAFGIYAHSQAGDITVFNAGDVLAETLSQTRTLGSRARGMMLSAFGGGIDVVNSGTIDVDAASAYGILAEARDSISVDNTGDVVANGSGTIIGLYLRSAGDVLVENAGFVDTGSIDDLAVGMLAFGDGLVQVTNTGDVRATHSSDADISQPRQDNALGLYLEGGQVDLSNTGSVVADARRSGATAVTMRAFDGLAFANTGRIVASATDGDALGIRAYNQGDTTTIRNDGSIEAVGSSGGRAFGIVVSPGDQVGIVNAGTITATALDADAAFGIDVDAFETQIDNTGHLIVRSGGWVVGVRSHAGSTSLFNSGVIDVVSPFVEGRIALQGGDGAETIGNTGRIYGAVVAGAGDDAFANGDDGLWHPGNHATDFGAGDDAVTNAAGGTIVLANAAIRMGDGNDTFANDGLIVIRGDSTIDMGPELVPNAGAALAVIAFAAPSSNPTPLVNGGVIDFLDGAPDDKLTLIGDLAGSGVLNLDVDPLAGTSDRIDIDGSVAAGTAQTVNVVLTANPAITNVSIPFATVTGDASTQSFVLGRVVGGDLPREFLVFGARIVSDIDASNARADTFALQIGADSLNEAGVLAASVAQGTQSLMASQIGTWRQRVGVVPPSGSSKNGLSAWVRVFRDDGSIDPGHSTRNFGNGGDFAFDQTNSGTEVGLNFEPTPGINLGVTLSQADGKQDLKAGAGSDKIKADTIGLYGTWIAQNGFYVDASYRAMGFDATLRTAGDTQKVKGHAGAINLETGYAWELGNGLRLEPQFQYTWTTVDKVFQQGDQAYFRSDDSDWQRARVGLGLWKPIESASGVVWTPYGAVSAVRVWDGKVGYTINDAFFGSTDTSGTSALVEAGLGLRKNGFSATVGANWTDGGALDGFVGGQLTVRYSW